MKHPTSDSKKLTDQGGTRRAGAPSGPRNANLRRKTIIETAGKLFVEKGYEATTMDEIAADAGFAKGTIYHYFANKAELLHVLREDFEKEVMNRVQSRVESCPVDDWRGRLKAWIEAAADAYFDMSKLHDVIFFGLELPFRVAMAEAEIIQYLAKLICDGAKAGTWQVDDEHWTALIMFYGFRGGCDEAIIGTQCAEDVTKKLYYLFLRMLGVYECKE
jgi:AcrR family transcriptional regulator